jgi:hypothetical protein
MLQVAGRDERTFAPDPTGCPHNANVQAATYPSEPEVVPEPFFERAGMVMSGRRPLVGGTEIAKSHVLAETGTHPGRRT